MAKQPLAIKYRDDYLNTINYYNDLKEMINNA